MNDFNTYQKTGRKIIDEYIEFIKGKEPIRRGCSSGGPCFCTGKCQEIIGWRDKIDENTILDIIRKLTEKSEKGNTVKIAEPKNPGCMNHSHNPPSHMVYSPGTYKHTCPSCGHVIIFNVAGISW